MTLCPECQAAQPYLTTCQNPDACRLTSKPQIDHGPASRGDICTDHENPDFHYPARFEGRVPKTVRTYHEVRSFWMLRPAIVAPAGIYPAWTNRHGAVSAILPDGERLGLLPSEYTVEEWLT